MARLLKQYVEPPRPCAYLPDRTAQLESRVLLDVSPEELEHMLVRGWRRFGPFYFRPKCSPCTECVPIRVPTATFRPSQSQKRAQKACASLRVELGTPRVDDERLALYHAWHGFREDERGWDPSPLDAETYALEFAFPHPAARELTFHDDSGPSPKLVGVGLCDVTPRAMSAIYFYYDPAYAKRSLGVANILTQIAYARAVGIPHVYLGFRVAPCESMRYKARYLPHELLEGRPGDVEEPVWREVGR
jgi:leucyl-tRNA---protein transferase